jgi:2-polyprenylphenol 6-hydroxylase
VEKCYDVAIVGGGLVGLVFATLMAKKEFDVALVDASSLAPTDLSLQQSQLRVSAINPASKKILENMGIWATVERYCAFEKMFVWDSVGRGEIQFDCTEIGQPCLGYIVENAVLHNALLTELKKYSNVTIFANAEPKAMVIESPSRPVRSSQHQGDLATDSIVLQLAEQQIRAKLLVGADGGKSWVRRYAHIDCHEWSYDHEALVTTVATETKHQKTAWQCFLPSGPLALLPLLDENTCSVVWSASPMEINRLKNLTEAAFNLEITNAFEYRLGNIQRITNQISIPLTMRHAKEYINSRLALIGDAAHTIHPLAGQGANLGFMDALALACHIDTARSKNKDWGEYSLLRKYQRLRKSENWLMILGMEVFKRLFESKSQFFVSGRSFGLSAINNREYLKNKFIYHATGL